MNKESGPSSRLLKALACRNAGRPPVWMMRQAGRSLPEYQSIKKFYSLEEMFRTPELICTITKQPLDILGVDAAILFADILHVPLSLGVEVSFPEKGGPRLSPCLKQAKDLALLRPLPVEETLWFVRKGIELIKNEIQKPLIGFCGAPFTVMHYMTEKGGKKWLYSDPKNALRLLQILTDQSIAYLNLQIEAGVDVIQIFDSWANLLSQETFRQFSLPFLRQIVRAIRARVPVIIFSRGASTFVSDLVESGAQGISFDWTYTLFELRKRVPQEIAVQGNLDPELLQAPIKVIEGATLKLLREMENDPGFIANLGHGVLPDTPVSHIQAFVETVKSF